MLFAIVEGEKVEATPKTKGICPSCDQEVFSKCGEINMWHWSHHKDESCDSWFEPETEWHKNWKLIFGKDNCEISIKKDGIKHIADIYTKQEIVIELQNSNIQKPVIRSRETFYGERMIWIINGKHFKNNFSVHTLSRLDEDEDYFRRNSPFAKQFGITSSSQNDINFSWSRPRRSWQGVQCHIFIDFGDENLFKIKDGMGTKYGTGIHVTKERFITKYGGNLELLSTLIDNSNKST